LRNFLLVNDDGIGAAGLAALADALKGLGTLFVCAPDSQQSGRSHAISLTNEVEIKEVSYCGAEAAWAVGGTPVDCTKAGIQFCRERGIDIDMVFSGVNLGSNLGADTLYSGTVGAASEAVLMGSRGMALSVNGHRATHFENPISIALELIDRAIDELPRTTVLSINAPDVPAEEIKGVLVCRLGGRYFDDKFVEQESGKYKIHGLLPDYRGPENDIDIVANSNGYATITPLRFDYTDYSVLEKVGAWDIAFRGKR
jgi:5'-nucleotidase